MNREERRKLDKQAKEIKTGEQLRAFGDYMYRLGAAKAVKDTTRNYMVISMAALRGEFNFGAERLTRYLRAHNEFADKVNAKKLTVRELADELKKAHMEIYFDDEDEKNG